MQFNKNHINRIFSQKFSFLDYLKLQRYFEDDQLNIQAKSVIQDQWNHYELDEGFEKNDLSKVYYRLYHSINQKNQSKTKSLFIKGARIAAVFAFAFLIYTTAHLLNQKAELVKLQPIEFISQDGFRNQFKLPDGTTGWLGQNSELKYYASDKRERIVELNGLAFFNVESDKKHPFRVQTPAGLNIEVLGTEFNVSSYVEENTAEVVLTEGSVSLSINNKALGVMKPNERIHFDANKNKLEKLKVNVNDYIAWKDGKLVLNDLSLEESLFKLSKFYNVEFSIESENIPDSKIRLVLENESLSEVLDLLARISAIEYEIINPKVQADNTLSHKKIIIKNK